MHGGSFVQDLAVVLGVAGVTGLLFRALAQPSILGYLLAGIIVGPGLHLVQEDRVHLLSEFGVVLVMFAVGLEFRVAKFVEVLPVSGVTGLIQIAALFGAGLTVATELGWSKNESLFLGACICISSTMVVSKILEQRPVAASVRRFLFGVLVLQDVAAIALIAVMTAVAKGTGASLSSVLVILGKLVLTLTLMVGAGMFVVPRFVGGLVKTKSAETLVVGAVGACFAVALLTEKVGYSGALGAFIAGILVAESGRGRQVEHAISAIRDMFAAVFFVSVGMTVEFGAALDSLPIALLLVGVVSIMQLLSVSLGGILSGSGVQRSVTAGLALGQIGEFAFILANIGQTAGATSPRLQSILVTVTVLTTLTTSLAMRFREPIVTAIDHTLPGRMRHLLSLYEVWFEELRARPSKGEKSFFASGARAIALDLLGIVICLIIWRLWSKQIGVFLGDVFGLPKRRERVAAIVASGLAVTPFVAALVLTARSLTLRATKQVFGDEVSPAAQALLRTAVAFLLLLLIGPPIALLFRTGLGIRSAWPILLVVFLVVGALVWQRAGKLDRDIFSHGERLLRAIAKQSQPERSGHSIPPPPIESDGTRPPMDSVAQIDIPRNSILPGLTHMLDITLTETSAAVGKTLIDLQLRTVTGAYVLAIKKPDQSSSIPRGNEPLQPGDTLVITGSHEDQDAALAYLLDGLRPESLPEDPSEDELEGARALPSVRPPRVEPS
ncbi:MAG TPA: cation:proton antiporter [Polyangiaceae bacterium]|nr:cation:proton antiporter [Polyangiaceae bacterium]